MGRVANYDRIRRLENALRRVRKDDVLSNTELTDLVGISKGAFTNLRNAIDTFPAAQPGKRNELLYPAKPAIEALLRHEKREDEAEAERQKRAAQIMGLGTTKRRRKTDIVLPPSEMLKLSHLRAEIEERERQQSEYVPVAEVRDMAARVYGVLGNHLSQLEQRVDPNGLLPPDVRALLGEQGRKAQLEIHRELGDMLTDDAVRKPSRTSKSRAKTSRS